MSATQMGILGPGHIAPLTRPDDLRIVNTRWPRSARAPTPAPRRSPRARHGPDLRLLQRAAGRQQINAISSPRRTP